jgi:hypothetical protein
MMTTSYRRGVFALGAFFVLTGCATANTASGSADAESAGKPVADVVAAVSNPRTRRDALSSEEIRASNASNAFELISKLRPVWLVLRGNPNVADTDGSVAIRVYYNGTPVGDISVLRQYEVSQLISIRWVDGITARSTYGGGHGRGVIAITGH